MAKFLVVHPVGSNLDLEAATPVGKAVKAQCSADAYWVRSWYVPEQGKFYCEWDAKDAAAVRAAMVNAFKTVPEMPVEGVYKIAASVQGEDFR
jgi:hypothetical protein